MPGGFSRCEGKGSTWAAWEVQAVGFRMPKAAERLRQIENELARVCLLLEGTDVQRAIVFGSAARAAVGSRSDIDLIFVRSTSEPFLARLQWAYDLIRPRIAMDILVYDPQELDHLVATNPFVAQAVREGVVIYERQER